MECTYYNEGDSSSISKQCIFQGLFHYLMQNMLPSYKAAIRRTEALAERYLLLDSLLFSLNNTSGKESATLVIPENCVYKMITL